MNTGASATPLLEGGYPKCRLHPIVSWTIYLVHTHVASPASMAFHAVHLLHSPVSLMQQVKIAWMRVEKKRWKIDR
jgi:hypothetical protein